MNLENVVDTFAFWLIGEHCCAQICIISTPMCPVAMGRMRPLSYATPRHAEPCLRVALVLCQWPLALAVAICRWLICFCVLRADLIPTQKAQAQPQLDILNKSVTQAARAYEPPNGLAGRR